MRTKSTSVFSLIGCVTMACVPLFPTAPVLAQQTTIPIALTPITQAQRDQMSRSVVAVQTVTLLRDRGVLDERQRERVATLERDLAAALAARDAVTGNANAAQARLELARTTYETEVTTLAAANLNLVREIEALRANSIVQASRLTDEEVRQRQRFADGDARALDIMEQLKKERLAARRQATEQAMRLDEAIEARDSARQFATAVGRGDPGRTSADVLARWDEAAALDPTDFWQHINRARLNVIIGRLEKAKEAAEEAGQHIKSNRERSVAQNELADILRDLGDGSGAQTLYLNSLQINLAFAQANPHSIQAMRDLLGSLNSAADIIASQGNEQGALVLFLEGLAGARALVQADSSSPIAKRYVLFFLNKVADIKASGGDSAGALAMYRESLEIAYALLQLDPRSTMAKRELALCLSNVAGIKAAQGDRLEALALYQENLVVTKALALADPSSASAKRDVSVSLGKVAGIKAEQGDRLGALELYEEALEIRRALALADRRSAQARLDVGISQAKIASLAPSQIRWRQVYEHFLAMQVGGLLAPSDQRFVAIYQRQADEQDRISPMRAATP